MAKKQQQQKAESLPLVAIDMGSDGVRAMAAERVGDDLFRILGVEQSQRHTCVEQGIITQTGNAGFMISEVLKLLANRIGISELPTAFVSVGGYTMNIVEVKSNRDQVRKREISQALLEDMERECKCKIEQRYPEIAVLGLVPSYFVLDGQEQDEIPSSDQRAEIVEAHYIAFYGRKDIETRLQKSFNQALKSIEHSFVRPEALFSVFACEDGNQILSDGCAILDMGAQTTTLTVFKGGQYLFNKVVAKGGYHITRLLEQQGISFRTAETLKKNYGYAAPDLIEKNLRLRIPSNRSDIEGEFVITLTELAQTITGKLEEILAPLLDELNTKWADRISSLYITGGASMLRGMDAYIQQKTRLQVLYGAHDNLLVAGTDERYFEPTYSALVGTLLLGQDYRDNHKDKFVERPQSIIDKFRDKTIELFSNDFEASK